MAFRQFLLKLLEVTREKKDRSPKKSKEEKPVLFRELDVPVWIVGLVMFILVMWVLWGQFGPGWQGALGLFLFVSIAMYIYTYYLRRYSSDILANSELAMLLGLIVIVMVLFIVGTGFLSRWVSISGYIVPITSGIMLITILINVPLALISLLVLSVLLAVTNNFNFNYFLVSVMGGLAGIYSTHSVRNRRDITKAGLSVSGANILAIFMIYLIKDVPFVSMWKDMLWGIGNGFLCVILTIGILPYIEDVFSIVTNIKLLELADFNQPLLKKLMLESPGTYHHSLIVGNLAETAAELVGADSLLVRVGAYYHDIGKLNKPDYFAENQNNIMNKHEELTTNMSSLILISHVKDGVVLATKHNLNKRIIDIIEQHHGTGLIHYFYMKALEKDKSSSVDETKYRYPGPKPKTREAAIVMLADSVEAAARTLDDASYERISDLVNTIINNKFTDGQLNDCNITLVNLHKIAESFINTLTGIYHTRVEYDSSENGSGNSGKKPPGKDPV